MAACRKVRQGFPTLTVFSENQANSPREIVKRNKSPIVLFLRIFAQNHKSTQSTK